MPGALLRVLLRGVVEAVLKPEKDFFKEREEKERLCEVKCK